MRLGAVFQLMRDGADGQVALQGAVNGLGGQLNTALPRLLRVAGKLVRSRYAPSRARCQLLRSARSCHFSSSFPSFSIKSS